MEKILEVLEQIKIIITEQNLLKKEVFNLSEAAKFLDLSESHLYKLTSKQMIPHSCPQGKKLYFNRRELEEWLQTNKKQVDGVELQASNYILTKKGNF